MDGKTYSPNTANALNTFNQFGHLDFDRLVQEKLIVINDTPVSKQWFKAKNKSCVYTGQVKNGQPNGFIRAQWEQGEFDEGFCYDCDMKRDGFARTILKDGTLCIGWYKQGKAHGNY